MEIRKRLFHLRKNILKLSQEEFSARIKIKRSALSHIENGKMGLTERNIDEICRVFHVSKDWLVNEEGPIFVTAEKSDLVDEIMALFSTLDAPYRQQILGYVNRLSEEQRLARLTQKEPCITVYEDAAGNLVLHDHEGSLTIKDETGRTDILIRHGETAPQKLDIPPAPRKVLRYERTSKGRLATIMSTENNTGDAAGQEQERSVGVAPDAGFGEASCQLMPEESSASLNAQNPVVKEVVADNAGNTVMKDEQGNLILKDKAR